MGRVYPAILRRDLTCGPRMEAPAGSRVLYPGRTPRSWIRGTHDVLPDRYIFRFLFFFDFYSYLPCTIYFPTIFFSLESCQCLYNSLLYDLISCNLSLYT